jgi:VIT1/CCC1 family predicted Fe2+/Mn2+ transporter
MKTTNPNVNKAIRIATIAGSSVLVINAVMGLTKVTSIRGAIMPMVTILVGAAAFNYAMQSRPEVLVKK